MAALFTILAIVALISIDVAVVSRWVSFHRQRHARFLYRVRVSGVAGSRVALGVVVEPGVVRAHELVVHDAMDRPIVVPEGQLFAIESIADAREESGEYTVPAGAFVWVLDYEPPRGGGRALPARSEPYVLTTQERPLADEVPSRARSPWILYVALLAATVARASKALPESVQYAALAVASVLLLWRAFVLRSAPSVAAEQPETNPHGSVTLTAVPGPLWVHGLRRAQRWLLPPKRDEETHVLLVAATDEDIDDESEPRRPEFSAACHALVEAVEIATDLHARGVVPVVTGRSRRHLKRFKNKGYEAFVPWIPNYPGRRLLGWLEALSDGTYVLHYRFTEGEGTDEQSLSGTLPELREALLSVIAATGFGARTQVPAGLSDALPEDLRGWSSLLLMHERIALAKPEDKLLPVPTQRAVDAAIDGALAFAREHGAVFPQAWLLAASLGIEAQKHGLLDDSRRALIEQAIEQQTSVEHPLVKLAPGLLTGLGALERGADLARSRLRSLSKGFRGVADEYTTWLEAIATKPDALPQPSARVRVQPQEARATHQDRDDRDRAGDDSSAHERSIEKSSSNH
ncbi:MAG: hypothetical protein U0269_23375 [Polyangiales bacterium]